ncbi:MAG: A24 family peptidase [Clostridia bacterium]|nr:A24 family peptidase [Clostridia bacterium]
MESIIKVTIEAVIFGGLGLFFGFGGSWFFNKMPAKWLCDYDEEPDGKLLLENQRIKTYPWKFVIAAFLMIAGVRFALIDAYFAGGALILSTALVFIAVADYKYSIIPDQLVLFALLSAIGFVKSNGGIVNMLIGAGIAVGILLLIAVSGKLIFKKWPMGGGDFKLYAALGLALGPYGFLIVFAISTILSALAFAYKMAKGKSKLGDELPLGPYIFVGTEIYLCLLYSYSFNLML